MLLNEPRLITPNPLAPNLSDRDLSGSGMGPVAGTGGLLVQFFYMRVPIKTRNARRNGSFETRLCVAKQPRGDRATVAASYITETEAQRLHPVEWAQFKQYQDAPTSGTPLHELPGVSQSQIMLLVMHGIRSIEDLLEISPDVANQVGLEAVTARKIAIQWEARRKGTGADIDLARQLAAQEIENETLRKRHEQMEATMAAMQAKIEAMAAMGGGHASAAVMAPPAADDGLPGLDDMPDTPFGEGGEIVTGNDDLSMDPDPLQEG